MPTPNDPIDVHVAELGAQIQALSAVLFAVLRNMKLEAGQAVIDQVLARAEREISLLHRADTDPDVLEQYRDRCRQIMASIFDRL